jgi:hypothetical protein
MLGSFGLWASSKGMKVVTDYVGMTKSTAESQIVTDGFILGTETAQQYTDAADQSKDGKIVSQTPVAGQSAPYESSIDLTYGVFNFTAFSVFSFFGVFNFTPFGVFNFTPFSVFNFTPFAVFNFFGVFNFTPFTVFNFSFFVFSFTPFSVFGFFTVFSFTPFSVFSFR